MRRKKVKSKDRKYNKEINNHNYKQKKGITMEERQRFKENNKGKMMGPKKPRKQGRKTEQEKQIRTNSNEDRHELRNLRN